VSTAESRLQQAYDRSVELVMAARDQRDDVLTMLEAVCRATCAKDAGGLVGSSNLTMNAALRMLERHNRFKVVQSLGIYVRGEWTHEEVQRRV
jgi:flagellar biosynthesis regulator FlaF